MFFGLGLGWVGTLLVGIGLQIIGYMMMPKPPKAEEPAIEDFKAPVAQAGIPIPVVFGTVIVKGLNVIYFGDKRIVKKEEGGGK